MTKTENQPLPTPPKRAASPRKEQAFKTLAVEEFSRHTGADTPPLSSDEAVEQARKWVEYDKL